MLTIRPPRGIREYLIFGGVSLALILLLLKACEAFPESSFTLANESRLPRWVTLPPGITRANVSVTLNYYTLPYVSSIATMLQDADNQGNNKLYGTEKCQLGFQLKNPPQGFSSGYPAYVPITVHGVTEIIEHRKMEPIFYVTDDPIVWKQYREFGCG